MVSAAPPTFQYKPSCTGPALSSAIKAAGTDFVSPPGADPVADVGDAFRDKNFQRGAVGVLYLTANSVKALAPGLEVAARAVPYVGEALLTFQALHSIYKGAQAYKSSIDQCYGN
jgi:hypothetical protein